MDLGRLARFHESRGPLPHLTLSLCRAASPWQCGIAALDGEGRVTRFVEKPPRSEIFSDLTNAGVLIMDREILDAIPPDRFYDIAADLLPALMRLGVPVYGQVLESRDYLIDIGTPEKYELVQREWPTAAFEGRLADPV